MESELYNTGLCSGLIRAMTRIAECPILSAEQIKFLIITLALEPEIKENSAEILAVYDATV